MINKLTITTNKTVDLLAKQQEEIRELKQRIHDLEYAKYILKVKDKGIIHLLKPIDIVHCEASCNYCIIYTKDGQKITLSKTLKTVQSSLPEELFIRIHQSFLVNKIEISQIKHNGEAVVALKNGVKLAFAVGRKREILARFKQL